MNKSTVYWHYPYNERNRVCHALGDNNGIYSPICGAKCVMSGPLLKQSDMNKCRKCEKIAKKSGAIQIPAN